MSLTLPQLEKFATDLSDSVDRWQHLVRHAEDVRVYEQIWDDELVNAWLICWSEDQDTGFHDHDLSCGAVAVIEGLIAEDRLLLGGAPVTRTFAAGEAFHFGAADIHRVRHTGADPAVTLHVYSPPLLQMGAYEVGRDGVLVRHAMSSEQELRPRAAA